MNGSVGEGTNFLFGHHSPTVPTHRGVGAYLLQWYVFRLNISNKMLLSWHRLNFIISKITATCHETYGGLE